jgi:chemotaxis methyl-accepting protein methylase
MEEAYPVDRDVDIVFCRNVLIYFDKPTQKAVLTRLAGHLRPGGYLGLLHQVQMAEPHPPAQLRHDPPLRPLRVPGGHHVRNVLIYFDKPTQKAVLTRLAGHLRPGGYLVVGHSEAESSTMSTRMGASLVTAAGPWSGGTRSRNPGSGPAPRCPPSIR